MGISVSGFMLPIRIKLGHSKRLFQWLMGLHLLLAGSLFFFSLNIAKWPLFIFLLLSAARYAYLYSKQVFPSQAKWLILDDEDNWTVITSTGERLSVELIPPGFVHPLMIALKFRLNGKKLNVVLLKDNLQADVHRRLRVRLRFPV